MRTDRGLQRRPQHRQLAMSLVVAALLWAPLSQAAATEVAPATLDLALVSELGSLRGAPVQLDATRLAKLQVGERLVIRFPLVGMRTMILDGRTNGLRGERYWHGSLEGERGDRVFIRQTAEGFIAGLRVRKQIYAYTQGAASKDALRAASLPLPSTQAWRLGDAVRPGVHALNGQYGALATAPVGTEVALPLPGGQTEVVVVTHQEVDADGFVQIQGVSRMDGAGSPTLLSVSPDGVFGVVMTQGREYQVVTRNGQTQLIDPTGAGWQPPRGDDHVPVVPPTIVDSVDTTAAAAVASTSTAGVPTPLKAGTVDTTITMLVTYSATYVSQWGTEALARLRLSNLVQVANAAYANSGTGIAFKITGWGMVRQPDATPQAILPALKGGTGNFTGVPSLKASSGAAMTVFFAPFTTVTGSTNTCGLAYVPAANGQGMAAYRAQAGSLMYAALNDGQAGSYYCESLTLAHELGHNLGNVHDKAHASTPGALSYSYGKGVSGAFGTVMSYISPRVALFSSPQLKCTAAGAACGSTTENVVATMLQTKATVAALGNVGTASAASEGYVNVAGLLLNANGTPYTGTATLTATNPAISCQQGSSGFYICKVPAGVGSVTLSVSAVGKTVAPASGNFPVNALSNTPITGTRFYLSAAAASTPKK